MIMSIYGLNFQNNLTPHLILRLYLSIGTTANLVYTEFEVRIRIRANPF